MKSNYQKGKKNCIASTKEQNNNNLTSIPLQQILFEIEPNVSSKQKQESDDNYIFDIMDALTAPVLTFSQQWADTIPKRMLEIVPLARMKSILKREQLATLPECVIYIYTRTLEAPMDSEWTDIYTHVSCKTLEEWFGENRWEDTKAPKELSEWLLQKLNGLRRHIYVKRRQILEGQLRVSKQMKEKMAEKEKKEMSTQHQKTLFT